MNTMSFIKKTRKATRHSRRKGFTRWNPPQAVQPCRNSTGFTLIELIISIVILIVGLVGVLLVIPLGQRTAGTSALTSRAAILASEKMEELKSKGYDLLVSQPEWSGAEDEYSWLATIADVSEDDFEEAVTLPTERLVKIIMEVSYTSHNKQRTETFVTFYSEL